MLRTVMYAAILAIIPISFAHASCEILPQEIVWPGLVVAFCESRDDPDLARVRNILEGKISSRDPIVIESRILGGVFYTFDLK